MAGSDGAAARRYSCWIAWNSALAANTLSLAICFNSSVIGALGPVLLKHFRSKSIFSARLRSGLPRLLLARYCQLNV